MNAVTSKSSPECTVVLGDVISHLAVNDMVSKVLILPYKISLPRRSVWKPRATGNSLSYRITQ